MDNYNFAQQGWQCPICKRVYSPSTPWCYYCGGESKISTTSEVSLDCWENNPILLTSNPPKLLWKCKYCGKEITTEVSEIPKTPCSCLGENKVMPQDQSSDTDMQICIIKGDLQYLAEKVNKLSSLIENTKDKKVD
jgi:hypothetical protein